MAAEAGAEVQHGAPRCLLRLLDVAAGGIADWSEFDAEAERWGIEVRGLSRQGLTALINSSQLELRRYIRRDGSAGERGPYWYFQYHEGGKRRKLYLGKTSDPQSTLAAKRSKPLGE